MFVAGQFAMAQSRVYPEAIRGYKVQRAVVELRKEMKQNGADVSEDALIRLGDPQLARVTPVGISLEVPIVVSPVRQKGHVDFLLFEEMVVNGTSVEIDEYHRAFDLPNKSPLTLKEPLKFYVYTPQAVLAAVDEVSNSKETWVITGRVYVFGKFNKSLLKFKRCIPVELKLTIRNPLRSN